MAKVEGGLQPGEGAAEEGFEAFFRRLYPQLVRIAYRVLGELDAAQDVAQDALLAAYGRYPDGLTNPTAWVRSAVVHQALNQIRSSRRRTRRETLVAPPAPPPSPEEGAVAAEENRRVRRALARLGADKAAVLVLRHSGLSYLEVAEVMGISPTSVGTTLRRAEEQFRREVER
ncbi:MAG TPA: sigma-70 family RNA polymerase sigma factor [Acidimicrobiales bacterium]|nr:sigma-70 family RNA polymerase sigma factor [Acidimicrobiales bacterium]